MQEHYRTVRSHTKHYRTVKSHKTPLNCQGT